MLGSPITVQGDTLEDAEAEFWLYLRVGYNFYKDRSEELDKWKPLQLGAWKGIATHWITIFGLHLYFRYGKNMKYGWYIPFTKLNITFTNYWLKK